MGERAGKREREREKERARERERERDAGTDRTLARLWGAVPGRPSGLDVASRRERR